MASLKDEFPELVIDITDALAPLRTIEPGTSAGVIGAMVFNAVMHAFRVLISKDLIYAEAEIPHMGAIGDRVEDKPDDGYSGIVLPGDGPAAADAGSLEDAVTVHADAGSLAGGQPVNTLDLGALIRGSLGPAPDNATKADPIPGE